MVVIALHEHGAWNQLTERCQVAVSSIVAYDEAQFHSRDGLGFSKKIDLRGDIAEGRVTELSATATEMAACRAKFDSVLAPDLHDGETECLALLLSESNEEYSFCTADKAALLAVALLELSERCVSLEGLLRAIGLQKPLPQQYTEEWLKKNLEKGRESRIYGRGLLPQ